MQVSDGLFCLGVPSVTYEADAIVLQHAALHNLTIGREDLPVPRCVKGPGSTAGFASVWAYAPSAPLAKTSYREDLVENRTWFEGINDKTF